MSWHCLTSAAVISSLLLKPYSLCHEKQYKSHFTQVSSHFCYSRVLTLHLHSHKNNEKIKNVENCFKMDSPIRRHSQRYDVSTLVLRCLCNYPPISYSWVQVLHRYSFCPPSPKALHMQYECTRNKKIFWGLSLRTPPPSSTGEIESYELTMHSRLIDTIKLHIITFISA